MLKKMILAVFFIVVIVGLAVAYTVSFGLAYPEPTIKQELTLDNKETMSFDANNQLQDKIDAKRIDLANQRIQLETQQDLLKKMKYEIEQKVNSNLAEIKVKYQNKIDEKDKALKERLNDFIQQKEQEFKERLMVKKEFYQNKAKDIVNKSEEEKISDLSLFQQGLNQKYYNEILNIKLKLNLLDLTPEEEKKYKYRLKELQSKQNEELETKEQDKNQELNKEMSSIENEYNQKFKSYQAELQKEIEKDIKIKKTSLDTEYKEFVAEQQHLLNEEIRKIREKLMARSQSKLEQQQKIVNQLQTRYQQIQSELANLKSQMGEG